MPADVRYGSKAVMTALSRDVRYTPKSGHGADGSVCPLCANSGPRVRSCGRPQSCAAQRLGLAGLLAYEYTWSRFLAVEKSMSCSKVLLAIATMAVVAAALAPTKASARSLGRAYMSPAQYDQYCGRLPAYGRDGCGHPEFSYGPDSCWRRVIVSTPHGPEPRRVSRCG